MLINPRKRCGNSAVSTFTLLSFSLSFFFSLFFGNFAFAQSKDSQTSKKWHSHFETYAQSGSGRSVGLTDLFLIIKQSPNSLFFSDIRAQLDDNNSNEYNLGLGYRKLHQHSIIGAYLYYDRRKSEHDNIFQQLTFGAERLGRDWDFRFNLYLPKSEEGSTGDEAFIADNKLQVAYGSEKPLRGADVEVGRRIALGNSHAYLGYYYYQEDKDNGFIYQEQSAVTARFETKLFHDSLALGAKVTYDQDGEFDEIAYLRLRIPFGFANRDKLSALEKRMTDTIIRDIDIVTNQYVEVTDDVTLNINGASPSNVSVIDLANVADIDDAVESKGENSLVVLTGTGQLNDEINLAQGQTILSGNSNLNISYKTSRGEVVQTNFSPNLAGATIKTQADVSAYDCSTGLGGSDCLLMVDESNITIKGVAIDGGDDAIYITNNDLGTINLVDLSISNSSNKGVYIHNSNNSTININNVALSDIGNDAISLSSADNNRINISDSAISDVTNDGIDITSGSNDNQINITNSQFNNIKALPVNNKDTSDSNVINIR
ncbi:MAG: inverse autotransporter beta domain-containing protein [Proteobacteria bacterium]|nr:inverse autotransporter beta domain-containing protein [Pseudomonadota bacterium]